MLTMNWKDLQYKRPNKQVNKKVIQKKGSQVVNVKYPLGKKKFSASDWEEYQQWIKQQKKLQQSEEKPSKPKKKEKDTITKAKGQKTVRGLKKALTRKEQYQQQLEHPLWLKKRDIILDRDQYQCRLCSSKHNLQVHHLKYSNGKRAWEYPNLDLITLCEDCHKKVHSNCKHQLYPKYQEIWYNIDGFSDYEATEFGRLRLKDSKKRIQWAHLGTKEHYIDSDGKPRVDDGNETQFTHITNDKGLVVWISKEKLLKLLKSS